MLVDYKSIYVTDFWISEYPILEIWISKVTTFRRQLGNPRQGRGLIPVKSPEKDTLWPNLSPLVGYFYPSIWSMTSLEALNHVGH